MIEISKPRFFSAPLSPISASHILELAPLVTAASNTVRSPTDENLSIARVRASRLDAKLEVTILDNGTSSKDP
ncbi:hypothetical protein D3C84_936010 [compost metagenome]